MNKRVRGLRPEVLVGCAAALAIAFSGLASDASAAFDELIPTKIGLVKFGGNPTVGKLYKLVSKAPKTGPLFQLPTANPATTGGSLTAWLVGKGRLDCMLAAQAFNGTEGWKTLGPTATPKGYKYINKSAPGGTAGACKIIIVKQKVIKAIAKGTGTMAAPVDNPPGNPDVETVLTLGAASDENYCALATAPHFKEKANKLIKAKSQLAPGACPTLPVTTTTTTASTTTTTGGGTTTTTGGGTTTTTGGGTTTTTGGGTTTTTGAGTTTTTGGGTTTTTGGGTTTTTGGGTTTTTGGGTTTTTGGGTTTTTLLPLDHYTVYPVDGPPGPVVNLVDQFHEEPMVELTNAWFFMPPAMKNDEVSPAFHFNNPHLTCYGIVEPPPFSAFVTVRNQFGVQEFPVVDPMALCLPTEKLTEPVAVPIEEREHYKCYGIPFELPSLDRQVIVADQFQQEYPTMVRQPFMFCNPVSKNDELLRNHDDHLACYFIDVTGILPPDVPVRNQFGTDILLRFYEPAFALCVPSEKLDWSTTTTPTSTTTTTTLIDTLCCEFPPGPDYRGLIPACLDAWAGHMPLKCDLLGGIIGPGVCHPELELCVPPPAPPSEVCCQCPVGPPFPNPWFCFETVFDHVDIKCQQPCIIMPGLACGPMTEECGGP